MKKVISQSRCYNTVTEVLNHKPNVLLAEEATGNQEDFLDSYLFSFIFFIFHRRKIRSKRLSDVEQV